jgi:hypothetical protein
MTYLLTTVDSYSKQKTGSVKKGKEGNKKLLKFHDSQY